ncbi:hypothetical protein PAMP_000190 [Pampus punctatissimus]
MEGSQTEERVLAKGGTKKERTGMEGVERLKKKEEGRVEVANGEDMMMPTLHRVKRRRLAPVNGEGLGLF